MNIVNIGGSRGIGKAAAKELLQDGHKVLIVGRNPKTLEETGKELAGAAIYSCDAGKAEETSDLGKVIALTFRLSPQAVLEEVNIRPLEGDTY